MSLRVPFVASGVVLLLAPCRVPAQPIFRPFTGERAIEMVRDIDSRYRLSRMGAPCGEYLLFEAESDEEIVTFKVPVTKREWRMGINALVRIDRRRVDVEVDGTKRIPTAEWVSGGEAAGRPSNRVIIRISRRDFDAAPCLAGR